MDNLLWMIIVILLFITSAQAVGLVTFRKRLEELQQQVFYRKIEVDNEHSRLLSRINLMAESLSQTESEDFAEAKALIGNVTMRLRHVEDVLKATDQEYLEKRIRALENFLHSVPVMKSYMQMYAHEKQELNIDKPKLHDVTNSNTISAMENLENGGGITKELITTEEKDALQETFAEEEVLEEEPRVDEKFDDLEVPPETPQEVEKPKVSFSLKPKKQPPRETPQEDSK